MSDSFEYSPVHFVRDVGIIYGGDQGEVEANTRGISFQSRLLQMLFANLISALLIYVIVSGRAFEKEWVASVFIVYVHCRLGFYAIR